MPLDIEFLPAVKFLARLKLRSFKSLADKYNAHEENLICLKVINSKGSHMMFYMLMVDGSVGVYVDPTSVPKDKNGAVRQIDTYVETTTITINNIIKGYVERPHPGDHSKMIRVPYTPHDAWRLREMVGDLNPVRARQLFDAWGETVEDFRKDADQVLMDVAATLEKDGGA